MDEDKDFLRQGNNYRTLKAFQKAECIYDETIANIAITLIHQCDILIRGLIEWKKRDFLEKGGIKEEMYQARKDWQKKNTFCLCLTTCHV
jgi:four helix bundle suffix protein